MIKIQQSSGSTLVDFPNLSLLSCSTLLATMQSLSTERTDHSLQAAAKLAVKIPSPADYRPKGAIPNNTLAQPRSSLNNCIPHKYQSLKFWLFSKLLGPIKHCAKCPWKTFAVVGAARWYVRARAELNRFWEKVHVAIVSSVCTKSFSWHLLNLFCFCEHWVANFVCSQLQAGMANPVIFLSLGARLVKYKVDDLCWFDIC